MSGPSHSPANASCLAVKSERRLHRRFPCWKLETGNLKLRSLFRHTSQPGSPRLTYTFREPPNNGVAGYGQRWQPRLSRVVAGGFFPCPAPVWARWRNSAKRVDVLTRLWNARPVCEIRPGAFLTGDDSSAATLSRRPKASPQTESGTLPGCWRPGGPPPTPKQSKRRTTPARGQK